MLSIISVNYFGKETLLRCVQSTIEHLHNIDYEIIIIDNSNDDYTKELILTKYPAVKWHEMSDNLGFGRANNYAFTIMKGDTALLLNPDCIIKDNSIANVYYAFLDSNYIACGIQLVNQDGSMQISGNYAMKGGLNYLLPLPYIGKILKFGGSLFNVKAPHLEKVNQEVVEVDWISGAFLMVKKEYITETKGFDEDFFLYAEEAEWCSRLKKIGKLAIFTQFEIVHLLGALSTEAFKGTDNSYYALYDKKGQQIMISNFVRIRKEFGLSWFVFIFTMYNISIPVYFLLGVFHSVFSFSNQLKTFNGYALNIFKSWRYLKTIIPNKPYFYKIL